MRVVCRDLTDHVGEKVEVNGWVHRIRSLGGVNFILLRDRTGIVQIVADQSFIDTHKIIPEMVVSIQGHVEVNEKAPQGVELHSPTIEIFSTPCGDLPLTVNTPPENYGIDTLLNNRLLSLRIPKLRAVFEVQSVILESFAEYLRTNDFTEIKTSKLINSGTEGGTGLFEVDYFETKVYLAQSPQLYKQAGVASGLERVFEIGNAYRAEKHETNRHLNEYVSLDIEIGFITDVHQLLDLEIALLTHIFATLQEKCSEQFSLWNAHIPTSESLHKTPRLTYEEAKQRVSHILGRRVLELDSNAEKVLSDWAEKDCGAPGVFVTEYPRRKRPFYTMPDDTGQKTKSFDFIFKGTEITSGGLREHRYDNLIESVRKFQMDPAMLEDYVSIFKYGCPPHGGFAIGLERLTQKLLGVTSVKLASMFPRDRHRTTP